MSSGSEVSLFSCRSKTFEKHKGKVRLRSGTPRRKRHVGKWRDIRMGARVCDEQQLLVELKVFNYTSPNRKGLYATPFKLE